LASVLAHSLCRTGFLFLPLTLFSFNAASPTELYTLSLHDALPIYFTGFAQKFGPVLSYIRIAGTPGGLNQVRIDHGRADALIGCDLVVSSSPKASATYRAGHTRAVVNTTEMSTADFVRFRDEIGRAHV